MQFLLENRLNGCQIFWTVRFLKPNPNRISVFRTSLILTTLRRVTCSRLGGLCLFDNDLSTSAYEMFSIMLYRLL